jgi:hypothetical protein
LRLKIGITAEFAKFSAKDAKFNLPEKISEHIIRNSNRDKGDGRDLRKN